MNKDRRKRLQEALDKLADMDLTGVTEIVRECADDEREAAESLEENFPGTERAERAETVADELEDVADSLEEIDLDAIVEKIDGAME